jgi:hypothetical protein
MDAMKRDERFAAHAKRLIKQLDPVPDPPRDELWERIDQIRRFRRPTSAPAGPSRWMRWVGALAAMLVLGIGIGRFSAGGAGSEVAPSLTNEAGVIDSQGGEDAGLPYRVVAVEYLDAAAALLTALPEDARGGRTEEVSKWAQELLVSTRLLLDSPAADDVQMAALFRDLELVLAQIATLSEPAPLEEVELIQDGIRENDVLMRVRAATNQRPVAGI